MISLEELPRELSFLKLVNGERSIEYRKSQWLITPFEEDTWAFNFDSKGQFTVDFRVRLENGSLLTDKSNAALLDLFKTWICIQTHYDVTGGRLYAPQTANYAVRRVFTLIDYFLLNSKQFKLSKYGLTNVTENDIVCLLAQLASSNEIFTSIYQWPIRLTDFLRAELIQADIKMLNDEIKKNPFLELDIPDEEDRMLKLTDQEIVYSRALLWRFGYYKSHYDSTSNIDTYRYAPNTEKLAKKIYADTLRGGCAKYQPTELLLQPYQSYKKEFCRAKVRSENGERLNEREFYRYRRTIRSLGQLVEIEAQVPIFALNATNSLASHEAFSLKETKRFRTVDHKIVLSTLCKAVEFAISYGPDILDGSLAVINAAKIADVSCVAFSANNDIRPLLTPKLRDLGVCTWHLGFSMLNVSRDPISRNFSSAFRQPVDEYFLRLRSNEGLHDLLRVFYGAVQFCVGSLMARRQAELIDLISGKTLDQGKSFLLFYNRKSGMADMRIKEARPIPSVAVKLVEMLEQFHKSLSKNGVVGEKSQLFSYPDFHSGKPIKLFHASYNSSLDIFCDYVETPLNENGERYYFRQHQLRRFFAMMFFWGNAFGGMDALRWFLGHTDVEHLYNYITESTPGEVLRAIKAHYGSEVVKTNPNEAPQLADIVEKQFGTREFSVLDSDELDEFVEDLIIEGCVEIEPKFFEGPDGKSYRVAIKVLGSDRRDING